ncbi:hypothetical protein GJ744_002454 [Endocarpon pusillum]|uniref:Uncharacterized protein n=1 Tax=Endocarpon pusillum TaxID=364733 RepID=A0A8H7AB91_9EURO|nr:hypothetical protein GJ744_002454 [Endocarpon pusillum]
MNIPSNEQGSQRFSVTHRRTRYTNGHPHHSINISYKHVITTKHDPITLRHRQTLPTTTTTTTTTTNTLSLAIIGARLTTRTTRSLTRRMGV